MPLHALDYRRPMLSKSLAEFNAKLGFDRMQSKLEGQLAIADF
jgi:hypothetical protein